MEPTVRKQKSGDQLTPGDWLAPGELLDGAAEVLHVLAYRPDYDRGEEKHVHLVVREQGRVAPYADVVGGGTLFDLASEADLAELREQAGRAQKIADIRALATWLEANPDVPISDYPSEMVGLHTGVDGVIKVRALGAKLNGKVRDNLDDRTSVTFMIGKFEYKVIAWHENGRPAEPVRCVASLHITTEGLTCSRCGAEGMTHDDGSRDQLGLNYTRADDELDDPTPVSGARVEPHVGGMTEGGLVDETTVECLGRDMDCGRPLPCPDHPAQPVDETGGYWPPSIPV